MNLNEVNYGATDAQQISKKSSDIEILIGLSDCDNTDDARSCQLR